MDTKIENNGHTEPNYWFVGARYGGQDQLPRFLAEGIWDKGSQEKYRKEVLSMRSGDRIAVKKFGGIQKNNLPFDNRGESVAVMAIRAIGRITENPNDGKHVKVDWTEVNLDRKWYFYTLMRTIWRVQPKSDDWKPGALIAFAFDNKPQDIERFRKKYEKNPSNKNPPASKKDASDNRDGEVVIPTYSVDDIIKDGCFLERAEIAQILERLRTKKNVILQGPPGTGKTWLAKRLAFALMGKKDESKVRAVQFHPNLSYEDFVRGWRPTGEGKLSLADGVFMEAIKAALDAPSSEFVVVIEEINRGNPAQIFGELLTLLEAGKRNQDEGLELCYPDENGKRAPVHIPENLYVVGTMNIADRSLALIDFALRRRFAFVDLKPTFGSQWRDWVIKQCGVDPNLVADIENRITELNKQIESDQRLGKNFQIGHSYVTPTHELAAADTKSWFRQVVETEIKPLLDEYWFDEPDETQKAYDKLIKDW